MGLEAVELVLAFEEAFGIPITDEDAVKMRTPRDVIDFVVGRGHPWTRERIAAVVREQTLMVLGNVDYGEDRPFTDLGVR